MFSWEGILEAKSSNCQYFSKAKEKCTLHKKAKIYFELISPKDGINQSSGLIYIICVLCVSTLNRLKVVNFSSKKGTLYCIVPSFAYLCIVNY